MGRPNALEESIMAHRADLISSQAASAATHEDENHLLTIKLGHLQGQLSRRIIEQTEVWMQNVSFAVVKTEHRGGQREMPEVMQEHMNAEIIKQGTTIQGSR